MNLSVSLPVPAALRGAALALALPLGAFAQTTAPADTSASPNSASTDQPIVLPTYNVSTLRSSLSTAEQLKEDSNNLIDSIVAQDVGKFPDNTVVDALSRIPGVQVSYSDGEFSGVVIRGLPNIETTVNGYEVFTGVGRGVALQDIPAELISGVDVYKSVSPDMIEGGVAGLIDVRLHRPFDFAGDAFAVTARGYYSSQAQKDSSIVSGLASDRWKVGNSEFGVLIDVSASHQQYEDQIADNYVHFGANGEQFDLAADSGGNQGYYADNYGFQIIPGTRDRQGVTANLQWRNDKGLNLYWDNLVTRYANRNDVNFFIPIPSFGGTRQDVTLFPAGFEGYNVPEKFDNLGSPARFVESLQALNTNTIASKQGFQDSTDGYQGAFGGYYDLGSVTVDGEFSYDLSTVHTRGAIMDSIIITPLMTVTYNLNSPTDVQLSGIDYTNASNYHLSQYFDQWDRDHSVEYAAKSDVIVRLASPFLDSLKFGVRYADRFVDSHSANPGSYPLPFATLTSSIPGLMQLSQSNLFVSDQQLNVRQWLSANSNFLLNNSDLNVLRQLAGQPLNLPAADPAQTFIDEEQNFATFGMANYKLSLGDMPLDGDFGVRFTDLHSSLGGFEQQAVNGSTIGAYQKTTVAKARWDALPSANGRLKIRPDLFLRASFGKTVTRPDYASLNPAVSLTSPGPTIQGSGSGGNPNLDPITSTNYDVALEYYPSKSDQFTVAGFYRTIDGYIQNYADEEIINGNSYSVTRPQSTHNGELSGAEATFTKFFDFLPGALKGIGIQANYTYITGHTQDPLTGVNTPLAQVSRSNYNLVGIYEYGPVSLRLAYNWRDRYIDSFNQPGIQPTTVWVQPLDRLDFSASYQVTKNLAFTIDATNLLGHWYHDNFGDLPMFTRDTRSYDKTYGVGIRYRYF
ncbi:MAG TPA: TonB-dependent receptor [Opitutaceae bacterium]|jgi:TonB-dependent receptor